MTHVRASLIVLNYNGSDILGPCLESLRRSMGPADELIVVDNASIDGNAELVPKDHQIRLIARQENNYIFGLNDGVSAARGRYIAFLNNDIQVAPDFVDRSLGYFDSESVFAVCPRILQMNGEDQGALTSGRLWHGIWYYDIHPHNPAATGTFFAVGGQSFFDSDKLAIIGALDTLFWPMYHEDIELSIRARMAGFTIRYASEAVVHHVGGHASSREFTPSELRTFVRQNQFLTAWKLMTLRELLVLHAPWLVPRVVVALVRGDWPTLIGLWRALGRGRQVWEARRLRFPVNWRCGQLRRLVTPKALGILP